MATKSSSSKKKIEAPVVEHVEAAPSETESRATAYLAMRIHQFLVSYGESARLSDIAAGLADDGASASLVRYILQLYPSRFIYTDRKWDVRARYLDRQRPVSKLLEEIVSNFDAPIAAWDAAHELGSVLHRSPEGTREVADRFLNRTETYAPVIANNSEGKFALQSWLLDTNVDYKTDADVLFYNFLPLDAASAYSKVKADWETDPVGAVETVIASTSGSDPKIVDNRLVLFLAWKQLGDDFIAEELYSSLIQSESLVMLPTHRWTNAAGLSAIRGELTRLAEIAEQMPEEAEPEEEAAPLNVSDADLEEFGRIISSSDSAVSAPALLQEVYDTQAGDRTYAQDIAIVIDELRANSDKFDWVGYDRFRPTGSLPPFIGQVPENLQFPALSQIPDENEDLLDLLLDEEGFERGIERDIRNPIAMDVMDSDAPEHMIWPKGVGAESRSIELVLKSHHKEIGTFPLVQIPRGFIAEEPGVVELTLRDARGTSYQVFADHETQLIYGIGLFDLYSTIVADSGAKIVLEKTPTPGEFRVVNNNETDEDIYVSPERIEQLQNYRTEIEEGPATSTHHIVRYVLEHSNQAMSYLMLLTEVNVVRRTTRRQLASILSAWPAFSQKGGLWAYDSKKAAEGVAKNKRKYIL